MIKTLLKRGFDHNTHCEDNQIWIENGNLLFIGVFDGCSSAIKSYFASELYSKLFSKAVRNVKTKDEYTLNDYENIKNNIIKNIHENLIIFKDMFDVSFLHLVSTMIIGIYDFKTSNGIITFVGDGVAVIDDKIIINEQNNEPEYLAHYLDVQTEDLFKFLNTDTFIIYDLNKSFSLSSDGILSFKNNNMLTNENTNDEIIKNFCIDEKFINTDIMLNRKYNILINNKYYNYDDVSIIRYIKE
jgi:hypothetical protein